MNAASAKRAPHYPMSSSLSDDVGKLIKAENQASWQRSVAAWQAHLDKAPPRAHLRLPNGFLADVELQPLRCPH